VVGDNVEGELVGVAVDGDVEGEMVGAAVGLLVVCG